jgi:hypothetical protein
LQDGNIKLEKRSELISALLLMVAVAAVILGASLWAIGGVDVH